MAFDFDNLVGGPGKALLTNAEIGHTQGGITANISPQNRMRTVDQFGVGECAVIHQGDQVRCTIPFAEWTAAVLAEIYDPGRDQTADGSNKFIGLGRSAGYIYTTQDLKVAPLLTADAAKRVQFYRATPIGEFELGFNHENDRIFNIQFACLVDETQYDGNLIGGIFLLGSLPTGTTTTTTTTAA